MTDDLGTGELPSPATNGASNTASAISVRSDDEARANDGADEKVLSTVTFLTAELNRLTEEISPRSNGEAKTNDGAFFIAEINRLAEENQQLKRKYNDVERRLALLKEAIKPFRTNDFLSSVCLIAGSAGVGAVLSYLSLNSYGWCIFVGMSAMLVIAGIFAKVGGPSLGNTTRQPGLSL
jgi:hypothetical protein